MEAIYDFHRMFLFTIQLLLFYFRLPQSMKIAVSVYRLRNLSLCQGENTLGNFPWTEIHFLESAVSLQHNKFDKVFFRHRMEDGSHRNVNRPFLHLWNRHMLLRCRVSSVRFQKLHPCSTAQRNHRMILIHKNDNIPTFFASIKFHFRSPSSRISSKSTRGNHCLEGSVIISTPLLGFVEIR